MITASINKTHLNFRPKQIAFLSLLLGTLFSVNAQEKFLIRGIITDFSTGNELSNVHVKISQRNVVLSSKSNGSYQFSLQKGQRFTLTFSHIGYETTYEPIYGNSDTLILDIKLKQKIEVLPVYNFNEDKKPTIVFKSGKINIADYEFYQDNFLFLVYEKRLNKNSEIYLVDKNEQIISKHFVPGVPVELYRDYLGNVNLICERAIYRVGIDNDKVSIYELPMKEFNQLIKPITDTLEQSLLFSDFLRQFPRFKYYAFNQEDTTVTEIKEVVHKDMDWKYAFEYEFLSNSDKQFAKRMARKLKDYDKFDVAASMTGFANGFLYETVYAPLFVINDTINIFDHSESKIWKFIDDTVEVNSVPFDYHKPKKKNSWKRNLIMDQVNGKVYGVFLKNGYYYLKEIDTSSGTVISEKKLTYQFVSKLKIKNGFVYYTYKPKQTLQKRFLYKEVI